MKVAVIFNEEYPGLESSYQTEMKKPEPKKVEELDFEPYFEIEESDPIAEYEEIAVALREGGHEAYILNIRDDIDVFFKDYKKNKPDVVFNLVEIYNDKAGLEMGFAGILEMLQIPFTGAPAIALGNCQNKMFTKKMLRCEGINTANFKFITKEESVYRHGLNYPIITKPAFEDASVGIDVTAVVHNHKQLKERIELILTEYEQPALIEEYIEGRELNVAVLGDENPKVLPISEIDFSTMPDHLPNIVSYEAKWEPTHEAYHKTIPICPSELPKKVEKKAQEIALNAFRLMKCRDYCRVDMRLSKNNELFVLEVNPNPDLTADAGFMRSAGVEGYSYKSALRKIVELAAIRGGLI